MIKDDGTVIHFNNPKVQASLSSNVFAITGHGETKGNVAFEVLMMRESKGFIIYAS